MSSDKLFKFVNIHYQLSSASSTHPLDRVIEDVIDINACIHSTARSAKQLGFTIHKYTIEVVYYE